MTARISHVRTIRSSVSEFAFFWPAFVAASASDMSALIAKHFANLAVGSAGAQAPEPKWSTSHTVALELVDQI